MKPVGDKPFPLGPAIDLVVYGQSFETLESAPATEISPSSAPVVSMLEKLFAQPNLEDYLARELAPSVNDPSLLLPTAFNNALRWAVDFLNAYADSDPRNARNLRRAARLMGDQVSLRELVQMYRSALLKG